MRVYLPAAKIERAEKLAEKRKVSVAVLLRQYLGERRSIAISAISLPASRADWRAFHLHVPRSLYKDLQARAQKMEARPWDLISAILLAAIPKS